MKIPISWATFLSLTIFSIAGVALSALLTGILVMLLWNWLVPIYVPTLPIAQHITYWQGWGLVCLISILIPIPKKT